MIVNVLICELLYKCVWFGIGVYRGWNSEERGGTRARDESDSSAMGRRQGARLLPRIGAHQHKCQARRVRPSDALRRVRRLGRKEDRTGSRATGEHSRSFFCSLFSLLLPCAIV